MTTREPGRPTPTAVVPASASSTVVLEALQRWRLAGQLRALDLALARLLHEVDAQAPPSLLLAGALAAHLEGRGHDCVDLAEMTPERVSDVLGWTSPSADELRALLPAWAGEQAAWADSPLIEMEPLDAPTLAGPALAGRAAGRRARETLSPLVLHRGRLYLRRYWTWESRVAMQIGARTAPGTGARGAAPATSPPAAERTAPEATLDIALARRWLDQLFPPAAPSPRAKARAARDAGPDADNEADDDADAAVDWQKLACALALRGRFTVITGGPGTGKTYTAARLLVLLQALHRGQHPLRVALAAPTGKAAARLRQAIDAALADLRPLVVRDLFEHDPTAAPASARTLHALLGARPGTRRFRHDASEPLEVDVLFVDEASMVHLEMMDALLDALPPQAHLVLLGDKDQLASVEAGAVLGDLCTGADPSAYSAETRQHLQAVAGIALPGAGAGSTAQAGPGAGHAGAPLAQHIATLRHSHRFSGAIGELARAVNRGNAAAVQARLAAGDDPSVVHLPQARAGTALCTLALEGRGSEAPGYRACFERLRERPRDRAGEADPAAFDAWARSVLTAFDRLRVLCAVREGPQGVIAVNAAIEQALAAAKLLPARRGEWYEGRPVMVTRNDPGLGVLNGDIGIALAPPGARAGRAAVASAGTSASESAPASGPPSASTSAAASAAGEAAAAPLRVYFLEAGTLRSVASSRLADVETAFALTVHKSQGSEFEHVVLVLPDQDVPVLTRELLYTAITRAKAAFTLAAEAASVQAAAGRLTRRGSGLRQLLAATQDAGR